MPAGHVAALAASPDAGVAVLEVDEGYLGRLITEAAPEVVVLLNLSRDQLDRIAEVRMLVDRWRTSLAGLAPRGPDGRGTVVVANADDPMVAYAAATAPEVHWVGAGQVWHDDAVGCPACGGRIEFADDGRWACDRCDFARPEVAAEVDGSDLVLADGTRLPIRIGLPGQFNRANAAMAAMAAAPMLESTGRAGAIGGIATALGRLDGVTEVAGRFSTVVRGRAPGPPAAGQEPGRVDRHLRPAGRDGRPRIDRRAVGQRPDGRRLRHQLAVGRPLRATGRAVGGGHRRSTARSGRAAPLCRGRPRGGRRTRVRPRPRHVPARPRAPLSSSWATTRPSPTCGGHCERPGAHLTVAVVYPDLLGTYGDGGNGLVLARRAAWRGIDVDLVQATSDRPLPSADVYTVGGGEDGPQVRAATGLAGGGHPGRTGGGRGGGARGVRRVPAHRPHVP